MCWLHSEISDLYKYCGFSDIKTPGGHTAGRGLPGIAGEWSDLCEHQKIIIFCEIRSVIMEMHSCRNLNTGMTCRSCALELVPIRWWQVAFRTASRWHRLERNIQTDHHGSSCVRVSRRLLYAFLQAGQSASPDRWIYSSCCCRRFSGPPRRKVHPRSVSQVKSKFFPHLNWNQVS